MVRTAGEDAPEQKLIDDVARFGWHCVHILAEGQDVEYSFTVGLFQTWQHPELIVFGLPRSVAHRILEIAADAARAGFPIELGQPCDALLEDNPCRFATVPRSEYPEHVGFARWYYEGDGFHLYQIAWPSRAGLFPWEEGATPEFRAAQPLIGLPASLG